MTQTPPPGMYPDPRGPGQNRYWDGLRWTDHTAPIAPAAAPGHGAPFGAQHPQHPQHPQHVQHVQHVQAGQTKQQNWFLRHKILSAVLAVVVIAVIGAAAGGGSDTETDNSDDQAAVATDTESAAPEETAASEKAKPSKDATATDKVEPSEEAEPSKEPEPKALAVAATKILQEFDDNELSADAKYKGQTLLITGVVDKIDTELFDDEKYILRIGGGGEYEFLTVNCNDMSTDELSTLNKGDKVTVRGEFDDGGDLGVEVKDCELP